jgi:rhodanese-related sulfurtransferase
MEGCWFNRTPHWRHASPATAEKHTSDVSTALVADVHEPVAIIEVRAIRHQDQLRHVDAGAAAVLRVRIHGEAGAIGRLDEDSTEPIAQICTDTRRSDQTTRTLVSYQANGTNGPNGTIDAWRPDRSRVTANSTWTYSTCRAHSAFKSWETYGSGATARTRSAIRTHRLKSGFNSWEDSGPDEATWKVSAHRIHCSEVFGKPNPTGQFQKLEELLESSQFGIEGYRLS